MVASDTTDRRVCTEDGNPTEIRLKCTPNQSSVFVRVTCQGQDAEHWAGQFGSCFLNEKLVLVHAAGSNPQRKIHAEEAAISPLNFSCDFNYGYGMSYFINGQKQFHHKWSNLTEFDWSLACRRVEDGSVHWPTHDGEHWVGGSSLVLKEGKHVLQQFSKTEPEQVEFKIVYKGNL